MPKIEVDKLTIEQTKTLLWNVQWILKDVINGKPHSEYHAKMAINSAERLYTKLGESV